VVNGFRGGGGSKIMEVKKWQGWFYFSDPLWLNDVRGGGGGGGGPEYEKGEWGFRLRI
jgi:hypothetical protein